jgi:hypothetical protein
VRFGWLLNNFADPGLKLSPEQREAVQSATDAHLRGRLLLYTMLIVVPPPMIAVWSTGFVDDQLGAYLGVSRSLANLILIVLVVVATWPWAAWAYGRLYTRPYRRALNETLDDFRICEACAYDLRGLDEPAVCPECGAHERRQTPLTSDATRTDQSPPPHDGESS